MRKKKFNVVELGHLLKGFRSIFI